MNRKSLCIKCENKLKEQAISRIEKMNKEESFQDLYYLFSYEGLIRKMILEYKFQEKSYLVKTFVNFLLKEEKIFEKIKTYDKIIPVPISKKRQKERGYNQSLLIALEISKHAKIQVEKKCLYRTKNKLEQSKLNKEERQKNIQGVYELKNDQILIHKKILLVDDIYTTGSTVKECCKILKEAEPKQIGVFVLAKD